MISPVVGRFAGAWLALVGATSVVAAQELDPRVREEARALSVQGVAAFEAHDYQRALESFSRAFELAELEEIRFNVALCLERLGRYREAEQTYEAALSSNHLDDEGRARARQRLEEISPRLATLVFAGVPGVAVRVDDELGCETPCEIRVDPGAHTWSARGEVASAAARPGERVEVHIAARTNPAAVETDDGWSPGWLFYTGVALAAIGAGGTIGFGLRSNDLLDEFDAGADVAAEGELVTLLANVSLGIAIGGALAALLDLVIETGE
jgi:tetratricopeptide (TPR) repeat protein